MSVVYIKRSIAIFMIGKFSFSYIDLISFIVLTILVWIKETTVNIGRHNPVT